MYKSFKNYGVKSINGITPNTPYIKPKYKPIKPQKPAVGINISNFTNDIYKVKMTDLKNYNLKTISLALDKDKKNPFKKAQNILQENNKKAKTTMQKPLNYYTTTFKIEEIKQINDFVDEKIPEFVPIELSDFYKEFKDYITGDKNIIDYINEYISPYKEFNTQSKDTIISMFIKLLNDDNTIYRDYNSRYFNFYQDTISATINSFLSLRNIPIEEKRKIAENINKYIILKEYKFTLKSIIDLQNNKTLPNYSLIFYDFLNTANNIEKNKENLINSINNTLSKSNKNIFNLSFSGSLTSTLINESKDLIYSIFPDIGLITIPPIISSLSMIYSFISSFIKEKEINTALNSWITFTDKNGNIIDNYDNLDKTTKDSIEVISKNLDINKKEFYNSLVEYFKVFMYSSLSSKLNKINSYYENLESYLPIYKIIKNR